MDMEIDKKKYADYIKAITPVHNLWISMGKAFITGGLICTLDFYYTGIFKCFMYGT